MTIIQEDFEFTVSRKRTTSQTCDWCKRTRHDPCTDCKEPRFDDDYDDENIFMLTWTTGFSHGNECGHTTTKQVDLCQDCRPKFFELLKKEGIDTYETEAEW